MNLFLREELGSKQVRKEEKDQIQRRGKIESGHFSERIDLSVFPSQFAHDCAASIPDVAPTIFILFQELTKFCAHLHGVQEGGLS